MNGSGVELSRTVSKGRETRNTVFNVRTYAILSLALLIGSSYVGNAARAWLKGFGFSRAFQVLAFDGAVTAILISLVTVANSHMHGTRAIESLRHLGWRRPTSLGLVTGVAALVAISIIALIFPLLSRGGLAIERRDAPYLLFMVLMLVVEEVVFRGFTFNNLRAHLGTGPALFESSAFYWLAHLRRLDWTWSGDALGIAFLAYTFQLLVFGIALGYLFECGGRSLWPCLLVHFGSSIWTHLIQIAPPAPEEMNWWSTNGWLVFHPLSPLVALATMCWLVSASRKREN